MSRFARCLAIFPCGSGTTRHDELADITTAEALRLTSAPKRFRLIGADGREIESTTPGLLGGNRKLKIYGRLDCPSAIRALPRGYAKRRVFFADEAAAIAAGYRPCGTCMRDAYKQWKARVGRSTS
jgi:hypothetical protein